MCGKLESEEEKDGRRFRESKKKYGRKQKGIKVAKKKKKGRHKDLSSLGHSHFC